MPDPTLRRLIDKVLNAHEWDITASDDLAVTAERSLVLAEAMDNLRRYVTASDLSEPREEAGRDDGG